MILADARPTKLNSVRLALRFALRNHRVEAIINLWRKKIMERFAVALCVSGNDHLVGGFRAVE